MLRTLLSELPGIWRRRRKTWFVWECETNLPSILLWVKVDDRAKDHQLSAATLEQRHLAGALAQLAPIPLKATWSSWHTLLKAEICLAILMIRLMAKSVRLITLNKRGGSTDRANEESYLIRLGSLMYLRKSTSACWKTDWELNSWKTWSTGSAKEREAM